MLKSLEHHEHAEHIAHVPAAHAEEGAHPGRIPALVVAVLAASLAVCEQGARHAESAFRRERSRRPMPGRNIKRSQRARRWPRILAAWFPRSMQPRPKQLQDENG